MDLLDEVIEEYVNDGYLYDEAFELVRSRIGQEMSGDYLEDWY